MTLSLEDGHINQQYSDKPMHRTGTPILLSQS